ncbi:MAG TPA: glycerol-3-phosphate 1-O-acyltransferase PlsY [Gemmatimonadales bacterium]|nr:glycerol-3-phosphate 1-O-acyltransferase PlsY [Gemmatimonadales bacterium]
MISIGLWLLASYLLGATPTSYLAGRVARGIDLREHGSKNLGATNVYRLLGWHWAIPVALIDIAKGVIPVAVFAPWSGGGPWVQVGCGVAAVLGHIFSPYVGFRGGKGVATAAGMFLALAPLAVAIALPVWGACLWLTGYVSLSSMVAAATFPLWVRLSRPEMPAAFWAAVTLAGVIVFSHRVNIRRLLAGTESRFRTRKELS